MVLAAQGFADELRERRADGWALRRVLARVGLLQMDSVNVVARAHYLSLFARLCALATAGGYAVADNVSDNLKAAIDGFAAGALLVMLVDSMIPDAREKSGRTAGLVTTLGFALATGLSFTS